MHNLQEVVITGAGVVTPLGLNLVDYWNSLRSSRSAICRSSFEQLGSSRNWYVSNIEGYDAKQYVQPRKTIKLLCEEIQFAFGASMMACQQAGISLGSVAPDRLSVCFGGEIIFSEIQEVRNLVDLCKVDGQFDYRKWAPLFMSNIYPLWMLKSLPNMAACHIGIAFDARGPVNTITNDEVSSLMAIHEAYVLLQRGAADVVIVGASSSYTNPTRLLQLPAEHYAIEQIDAPDAIRPYDKRRIGMARGEGAGCIVLERAEHAKARGAKPIGMLCSVASGFSKPEKYRAGSAKSISNVVKLAVERAGISMDDIDHVNTGAGGSAVLDAQFARGVADTLPDIPQVAIQGGMGNIGAASGMCELIASLVAAQHDGCSPHTTNFQVTDEALKAKIQAEPGRSMQRPYVVKVSHTPHGQSAALVAKLLDL